MEALEAVFSSHELRAQLGAYEYFVWKLKMTPAQAMDALQAVIEGRLHKT